MTSLSEREDKTRVYKGRQQNWEPTEAEREAESESERLYRNSSEVGAVRPYRSPFQNRGFSSDD